MDTVAHLCEEIDMMRWGLWYLGRQAGGEHSPEFYTPAVYAALIQCEKTLCDLTTQCGAALNKKQDGIP